MPRKPNTNSIYKDLAESPDPETLPHVQVKGRRSAKKKPPKKRVRRRHGFDELVDSESGAVVERHPEKLGRWGKRDTIDEEIPKGMELVVYKGRKILVPSQTEYPFTEEIADYIVGMIMTGKTMKEVLAPEWMPPEWTVNAWCVTYPDFRTRMQEARRVRAEGYHDKVIEVAETPGRESKGEVERDKLKITAYKWAAQVGDPGRYGPQTKLVGDPDQPISFVIDTGVRRPGDDGYDGAVPVRADPAQAQIEQKKSEDEGGGS